MVVHSKCRYYLPLLGLLLAPVSVSQDPGQLVGQYHPTLSIVNGRFGWLVGGLRKLGFEEHVNAIVSLGDVAHSASEDLLGAALIACKDHEHVYWHCDTRHFNATVAKIRQRAGHSLEGLGSHLEWSALPPAWQILPRCCSHWNQFVTLLVLARRALYKFLSKAARLHGHASMVPASWLLTILNMVQQFSGAMMVIADRFVAMVTLKSFAKQLEEELPGSSSQSIIFDESLGTHHVEILSALLNRDSLSKSDAYMVELGTFEGQTPDFLLRRHPDLHVVTIDPFDFILSEKPSIADAAARRDRVHVLLRKYGTRVTILPTTSQEASAFIANGMFQLVFVDGGVREVEVQNWKWKVRPGGFLVGHDFKVTMTFAYILEIFRAVPRNETLHLAADWIWFCRMWTQYGSVY